VVLFPVLSQDRNKAQYSFYLDIVRNEGIALFQYELDYDETFPGTGCSACGQIRDAMMMPHSKVYPYVHNANIFQCPSTFGIPTLRVEGIDDYGRRAGH